MDREKRKANLKKLQLPSSVGSGDDGSSNLRKPKNSAATSSISNYFTTPNATRSEETIATEIKQDIPTITTPINIFSPNKEEEPQASTSSAAAAVVSVAVVSTAAEVPTKCSLSKRTKLTAFACKDVPPPKAALANTKACKAPSADDFEIPQKKVKKAPKIKIAPAATAKSTKSRTKRQQNIKSAFLRNEQIFSEITAQHCLADNFSPDDVELALAISKSEAETSGIYCTSADEDVVDLVADKAVVSKGDDAAQKSIRNKLQKYGFRTAAQEDYNAIAGALQPGANNRRNKSKWANKFTALTLRIPEYQLKKVNERIEAFLGAQCITKSLTASQSHIEEYLINSNTLKKYKISEMDQIFRKGENKDNVNLDEYFVKNLFEVSHVNAGHLLKNWGAIQGRDLSPKAKSSRRLLLEQKLQKVYSELEQYFNACEKFTDNIVEFSEVLSINSDEACAKRIIEPMENVENPPSVDTSLPLASTSINSTKNSSENTSKNSAELDKLLELIADMSDCNSSLKIEAKENKEILMDFCTKNSVLELASFACTNFTKELPNKKLKLNTSLMVEAEVQPDVSFSTNCTPPSAITQRPGGGTNSPDLFADSDIEMDEAEVASATQNVLGITTYEIYSSDEVKTSSVDLEISSIKAPQKNSKFLEKIVDLTQEEPEINIYSNTFKDPNSSQRSTLLDCNRSTQKLNYKGNENNSALNPTSAIPQLNISTSLINADFNWNLTSLPKNSFMCPSISDNTFRELSNKYLKPIESVVNAKRKSISMTQLNEPPISYSRSLKKSLSFTQPFNSTQDRNDLDDLLLHSLAESYSKSSSFNLNFSSFNSLLKDTADVSIDLTQNDEDEELVLSDDEINYSIWKANKTNNFTEQSEKPIDTQDLTLSSDSEQEASLKISNQHEYSFLDLIDDNKSFHAETDYAENLRLKQTKSALSFDGDIELISSQFLATPCKSNISVLKRNDLIEERAEFGILESYSEEPFATQSPTIITTTKLTTQSATVDDELANASFLQSPSESSAPLKRYSTNSHKFNDLLHTVQNGMNTANNYDNDFDELDEFDKLVYGSPPPKLKSATEHNQPSGLEQLLNGEISFREEETPDYRTPKKLYISPSKNKSISSQKSSNKSETNKDEEELQINGRAYRVLLCTSPKPDFSKQSEAELLKQLYSFGIKPLKRKQSVKILEYIYNQTHPLMVAQDQADDEQREKPSTSKHCQNSGPIEFSSQGMSSSQPTTQLSVASSGAALASEKLNLRDCFGAVLMRFSHELCAELCEENEEYVFQTNISKKVPQPLLPLHIAWYNLICANPTLHETILMFEPIDLQEVYLFLKGLGYRYDPKDLKIFFDRRCIIFRYDLTASNGGKQTSGTITNNRHVRKRTKNVNKRVV